MYGREQQAKAALDQKQVAVILYARPRQVPRICVFSSLSRASTKCTPPAADVNGHRAAVVAGHIHTHTILATAILITVVVLVVVVLLLVLVELVVVVVVQ